MRHDGMLVVLSFALSVGIATGDGACAQETGLATFGRAPQSDPPRSIPTVRIPPDTTARPAPPQSAATSPTTATIVGPGSQFRMERIRPADSVQRSDPLSAPDAATPTALEAAGPTRAVLAEETSGPEPVTTSGSAVWRTERDTESSGLVARADISLPERGIGVTWVLRLNSDKSLPASHLIEISFRLPPDFPDRGVSDVPGLMVKSAELMRGVPLTGAVVQTSPTSFLIGLSPQENNLNLLAAHPWMDIPIFYGNGRRAILALDKGVSGARAINDAMASWQKK